MDDKITIDLDRETFEALAQRAEAHGKRVDQEAADIVREGVGPLAPNTVDFVAWSRRIRAMTPEGVPQTSSVQLIREDRDRGHSVDRR
jgi:plasmid stability protein